jgi:predicted RNA-binding protein with PIN domain
MHASFGDPAYAGDRACLEGRVPVSAAASYAAELTAYTRGEGSLSITPDGYDLCVDPEAVLAESSYQPLSDLENTPDSVFCSHGAGVIVPWDQVPSFAHCEIPTARLKEVCDNLEALGLLPSKEELSAAFNAENDWGKRAAPHSSSPSGSLEEDAEFMAVYAREFGSPETEGPASAGKQARPHAPGYKKKGQDYAYPQIKQKHDKQGNPIYPKKDTREEYLIVDGYNIIFQLQELNAIAADGIDAARGALLDILSNYQGYTGQKISVVFDAYRTERTPASRSTYINIEVIFTKKGETADAFIEREVHENAGKYKITVATSDALEQLTVLRLGALRMSARMLAEDICRVAGRFLPS